MHKSRFVRAREHFVFDRDHDVKARKHTGVRAGSGGRGAVRDPLPDDVYRRLGQRGLAKRHLSADRCMSFELLDDVARIGLSRSHALEGRNFHTWRIDQHCESAGFIQAETERRSGTGVAGRADRREHVILD